MPIVCTGRFLSLEMKNPDYADRLGVLTSHLPEATVWHVAPDCLPGKSERKLFLDTKGVSDRQFISSYVSFGFPVGANATYIMRLKAYYKVTPDLVVEPGADYVDFVPNNIGCLLFEVADPYHGQLKGPVYLVIIDPVSGNVVKTRKIGIWDIGEMVNAVPASHGPSVVVSLIQRAQAALSPAP